LFHLYLVIGISVNLLPIASRLFFEAKSSLPSLCQSTTGFDPNFMAIDPASIHRLVETHLSYAHAIAAGILKTLPRHVERAELESAAELGLTEAASSFDHRPGVQFKTFAYYRIRGAIYDSIRKATWFTRDHQKKAQVQAEAAVNEYFADAASQPAQGPCDLDELDRHVGAAVSCYMLSLDSNKIRPAVDPTDSAEKRLLKSEQKSALALALERLPERNRVVLEAYYFAGRTLEDIGAEFGLSKSWTCRLHAKGIELLRDSMGVRATSAASLR